MVSVVRRLALGVLVLLLEFAAFEAGLRLFGASEASPGFQSLFVDDPVVGHRLKPGAETRYTTAEFSTDLRINQQGVRDDADIGPKAANERRVLVLGDSLVLAVQVDLQQTFCKGLEARLNQADPAHHWRVINGGVQGAGPVEEWLFYRHIGEAFEPDVVLVMVFVANAAPQAYGTEAALDADRQPPAAGVRKTTTLVRRVVRSSMVLQLVHVRYDQMVARLTAPTVELSLASYLATEPAFVAHGLDVTRLTIDRIATRAHAQGARTGIVLMPARFQTDDQDYARLVDGIRQAGGTLVRNAATVRVRSALAPLGLPTLDLLPVLAAQPDRADLFFQQNVHLTPRGHAVVADALFGFLERSGLLGR